MPNETTNTKPKRGKKIASSLKTYLTKFRGSHPIGILALIFSIVALIVSGALYYKLNKQIKDLSFDIRLHAILSEEGSVNLTEPEMQNIGDGFKVSRLAVEQHLTGVKVKGLIINSTSLTHVNPEFQIAIASQTKIFTVNQISAGSSTAFEVYVPDVPIAQTKFATIKFSRSRVRYSTY